MCVHYYVVNIKKKLKTSTTAERCHRMKNSFLLWDNVPSKIASDYTISLIKCHTIPTPGVSVNSKDWAKQTRFINWEGRENSWFQCGVCVNWSKFCEEKDSVAAGFFFGAFVFDCSASTFNYKHTETTNIRLTQNYQQPQPFYTTIWILICNKQHDEYNNKWFELKI